MYHLKEVRCPYCHDATHVRVDPRRGETICTQCSRVVQQNLRRIDTFAAAHGGSDLGSDPLTLTTCVGSFCNDRAGNNGQQARKRHSNRHRQRRLERWQQRIAMDYHTERVLYLVNVRVDELCSRLKLSTRIARHAKFLMKEYTTQTVKPIKKTKILSAVFTFMACRRLQCEQSFESFVATGLIRKRELGLYYKKLRKLLNVQTTGCDPLLLIKQFYHQFAMTPRERKRTERRLTRIINENRLGGRSPKSLISVALFLELQERDPAPSIQDIALKLKVAPNTSSHCLHLLLYNDPKNPPDKTNVVAAHGKCGPGGRHHHLLAGGAPKPHQPDDDPSPPVRLTGHPSL